MMARTTNQKAGKEVRVARQQTVKSEPRTLKQSSSKSRELLTDKENTTPESSIIKPGGALAKLRAKSPTRAQTPPILQRQKSKERKIEEEKQAHVEKEKALAIMRSKQLDLERLKELCQPKKIIKNEEEEEEKQPKQPRAFTEEELSRQRQAVSRLYQAKKQIEDPQQKAINERNKGIVKKLRQQVLNDKKRKEEKERQKKNNKTLAITNGPAEPRVRKSLP